MPKKIDVNLSTLVDLKAELFRKQEQFKRQKTQQPDASAQLYVKSGKPILHERRKELIAQQKSQNRGSETRRRKIEELEEAVREEERQLSRSKQSLEAKAALYEKLKSGRDDYTNPENGLYLVNFERKAYNERQSQKHSDSSEDEEEPATSKRISHDESEWVEYTDSLGRTRRCLRQDLPEFIAADERLKTEKGKPERSEESFNERSELLSTDMLRDLQRRQWEEEEVARASEPIGPVHYQHLATGEARELGVGYFPFSAEETARQDQMQLLENLRKQTVEQRERNEKLKEKRRAAMKARIEKVKERKKLKLGEADDATYDDSDDDVDTNLEDIPLPPAAEKQEKMGPATSAKPQVRPWDIGKNRMLQQQWTDKRRDERQEEFAPPSFYYKKQ